MNLKKKQFAAVCFGAVLVLIWLVPILPSRFGFSGFLTAVLALVAGVIAAVGTDWDEK